MTAYLDRRAAELRRLATVVGGLIGFTVQPPIRGAHRGAVRLDGPGGEQLSVGEHPHTSSRLLIAAHYPARAPWVISRLVSHQITVAVWEADTIAGEIERWLLPNYRSDLNNVIDALHRYDQARAARQAVADHIQSLIPTVRRWPDADIRHMLGYNDQTTRGHITILGDGDNVAIQLAGPTSRLLPAFITALTTDT